MSNLTRICAAAVAFVLPASAGAKPESYEFDKTHTTIRASWNHWGYSRQAIEFTNYSGTLKLDFDKPAKSTVEVEFNLANGYWVGAPESDRFENHLASPDLFDIAQFPTARFTATAFESEDGKTGVMRGKLTIKEQTHDVALNVRLNNRGAMGGKARAGFSATGTIDRSQWGLGFGSPAVSNEIDISIETELVGPAVRAQ